MLELWNVCRNEWMKLVRRRRLWVVGILGLLVVGLFTLVETQQHRNERYADPAYQITNLRLQIASLKQMKQTPNINVAQQIQMAKAQILQQQNQETLYSTKDAKVWTGLLKQQVTNSQQMMDAAKQTALQQHTVYAPDESGLLTSRYELAHHLQPLPFWHSTAYAQLVGFLGPCAELFLPLMVVMLVSDMLSGETSTGTIKLLLVRPVSRSKIWIGKWLVSLFASALISTLLYGSLLVVGWIIFGTAGARQPLIVGESFKFLPTAQVYPGQFGYTLVTFFNHAHVISQGLFVLAGWGFIVLAMMAVASIGMLCSTIFQSAMAATAVSLGAVVVGFILETMASAHQLHLSFVSYLFSTQLNLLSVWSGAESRQINGNLPLWLGILVLIAWSVVSLGVALWNFRSRDVQGA